MKPPRHLLAPTRRWFAEVLEQYELEPHHLRLLTLAGESWDRCTQARMVLTVCPDRNVLTFSGGCIILLFSSSVPAQAYNCEYPDLPAR